MGSNEQQSLRKDEKWMNQIILKCKVHLLHFVQQGIIELIIDTDVHEQHGICLHVEDTRTQGRECRLPDAGGEMPRKFPCSCPPTRKCGEFSAGCNQLRRWCTPSYTNYICSFYSWKTYVFATRNKVINIFFALRTTSTLRWILDREFFLRKFNYPPCFPNLSICTSRANMANLRNCGCVPWTFSSEFPIFPLRSTETTISTRWPQAILSSISH